MKHKAAILLTVITCIPLLFAASCADKSSTEACQFQTTMDLDQGNYDAVLNSSCATPMQLGAAWFGKAGFDLTNVLNRLVDANNTTSGSQSPLNIYMTSLVSQVTVSNITFLDSAHNEYASITDPMEIADAQFNLSIVDVLKSLSLLKSLIGTNTISSTCDKNDNGVPDEVDAASAALLVSAAASTAAATAIPGVAIINDYQSILISGTTGTYWGLVSEVTGTGTNVTGCPSPNQYKKLLFSDGAGNWPAATTFPPDDACTENPASGRTWPCPYVTGGAPVDLVTTIDQTLTDSIAALNTSLSPTTTPTDAQQSITDIKAGNCCNDPGENPLDTTTCTCSQTELSTYLQTI